MIEVLSQILVVFGGYLKLTNKKTGLNWARQKKKAFLINHFCLEKIFLYSKCLAEDGMVIKISEIYLIIQTNSDCQDLPSSRNNSEQ